LVSMPATGNNSQGTTSIGDLRWGSTLAGQTRTLSSTSTKARQCRSLDLKDNGLRGESLNIFNRKGTVMFGNLNMGLLKESKELVEQYRSRYDEYD